MEDLSVGLVGQPVDGIVGYTPAAATVIVRSIVISTVKPWMDLLRRGGSIGVFFLIQEHGQDTRASDFSRFR